MGTGTWTTPSSSKCWDSLNKLFPVPSFGNLDYVHCTIFQTKIIKLNLKNQKDVHTYVVLMSFASKIICCNMNFSNHNKTETATLAKLFMHIAQLQIEW